MQCLQQIFGRIWSKNHQKYFIAPTTRKSYKIYNLQYNIIATYSLKSAIMICIHWCDLPVSLLDSFGFSRIAPEGAFGRGSAWACVVFGRLWNRVEQSSEPSKKPRISLLTLDNDVGVSKNRGTPKWMVYDGKPPIKMDDLGVPLFLETPM